MTGAEKAQEETIWKLGPRLSSEHTIYSPTTSNKEPKMDEYNVLSQKMSVEKTPSLELKADPTGSEEGASDDLPCKFDVLAKRKLSFQLEAIKPLGGKLQAIFEKITTDTSEGSEPTAKRRRFQRRNSKTASMLSVSMLPVLALDLAWKAKTTTSCPEYDEDINIAEDLVRLVQASRKRSQAMGFSFVKS